MKHVSQISAPLMTLSLASFARDEWDLSIYFPRLCFICFICHSFTDTASWPLLPQFRSSLVASFFCTHCPSQNSLLSSSTFHKSWHYFFSSCTYVDIHTYRRLDSFRSHLHSLIITVTLHLRTRHRRAHSGGVRFQFTL
ncbi:hypothetical protein C8R48DRAFT_79719 [Suillus tomentosus]|nr:hypothetical protein C8R48DRAFT_79719 [Suillus tomentosus]